MNYWAVLVAAVLAMVLGALWYGPMFGRKWMEIVGVSPEDMAAREKMKSETGPLYFIQFVLVILQASILSTLIKDAFTMSGLMYSLLVWLAFIMPTIAGSAMWNNDPSGVKWARFWIQSGYQLIVFVMFGLILG